MGRLILLCAACGLLAQEPLIRVEVRISDVRNGRPITNVELTLTDLTKGSTSPAFQLH